MTERPNQGKQVLGGPTHRDRRDARWPGSDAFEVHTLVLQCEQDPIEAQTEPTGGIEILMTEQMEQPVGATTEDLALPTEGWDVDLEDHPRVVIQPSCNGQVEVEARRRWREGTEGGQGRLEGRERIRGDAESVEERMGGLERRLG